MKMNNDAHRLFVQVLVSKRTISIKDAEALYLKVAEKYEVDAPVDRFSQFLNVVNQQLKPLYMEIKRARSEHDGEAFFSLVNTVEDEHSKMATDYTPQEMEFIKKLIDVLVTTEEGEISSIDTLHLGADLTKKMSASAAEIMIQNLTNDGWLSEVSGQISFGPRTLAELGHYLKKKYEDRIKDCNLCKHAVFMGDVCMACGCKFHKYCISTALSKLQANKRKCPSCKEPWESDLIKLNADVNAANGSALNGDDGDVVMVNEDSSSSKRTSKRSRR